MTTGVSNLISPLFIALAEASEDAVAIREAAEPFRLIWENARHEAVCQIDSDMRIGSTLDEVSRSLSDPDLVELFQSASLTGRAHEWLETTERGVRLSWKISLARDEDGRTAGFLVSGSNTTRPQNDVTERTEAEEALQRLAAIVESTDDAIIGKTLDGVITSWNPAAEQLYHYSRAEILHKSISVLIPPERAGELAFIEQRLKRGERIEHYDTVRVRKDGKRINVAITVSPIISASGQIIGASSIARDITDRKSIENENRNLSRELAKRVSELQTLLDVIPVGVGTVDATEGKLRITSRHGRSLLGLPGDADLDMGGAVLPSGFSLTAADGKDPVDVEHVVVERTIKNGEEVSNEEWWLTRPDGVQIPLLADLSPIKRDAQATRGGVVIFRNIARIKAQQEVLQQQLARETRIANDFQSALAPDATVLTDGYSLNAVYRPALEEAEVGGDIYDWFPLDEGKIAIVLADVSGKGLTAAVYTAMVKYMLRAYTTDDYSPSYVVSHLNNSLCRYTESHMFVTLYYGVLDTQRNVLEYTCAGHEPPVFLNSAHDCEILNAGCGSALGILPDLKFETRTLSINLGSTLLLYTDGVSEAAKSANGVKTFLGVEGIASILKGRWGLQSKDLVEALFEDITEYAGGRLRDDAILLALTRAK